MNRYIYTCIAICLAFILPLTLFTACMPDDIEGLDHVPEGEQATVSLKLDLDDISVKTRADMNENLVNKVECLWVAIYNARTGERTFSKGYEPNGDFPESEDKFGTINDIETTSGNSYIVAVANYKNCAAIDITGKKSGTDLETLLANAMTWDDYRAIAIKQNIDASNNIIRIEVPATAVVMQGSYRASDHAKDYTEDEGAETVGIQPGTNNLTGKIHLRRIWTQNKFTIKPSEDLISMELVNVEVVNVPALTWLYGRAQEEKPGTLGYANAGDACNPGMDKAVNKEMYQTSATYTPASMTVTTDTKGRPNYAFDYWQFENKRTSKNENCTNYAYRESEYKNNDGTNSGIYKSLCGEDGTLTLDNNATFIRFTARISYYDGKITNPGGLPDEVGQPKIRNAEATYVVHLGYVGDDTGGDADGKAKDFNCYRNSQYQYNITVKGVDNILLEAYKKGENQPGAEGSVTDVTDTYFDLDCHYNVFNVYFTKEQLANFTFTMTTYKDDEPHTITNITDEQLGLIANVPTSKNDKNWKYYSWIQLVQNGYTNQTTLIKQFPKLDEKGESNEVLYLNNIRDYTVPTGAEGVCFTVYVKEYTYVPDYGEENYGNENATRNTEWGWPHFVNQPSRTVNFNVAYSVSDDKESQHFRAKYALSQRSIQTYYDITKATTGDGHGTALGVEHVNEVFGMNIRWTIDLAEEKPNNYTIPVDPDNGRYNVWLGLKGKNNGTKAEKKWEDAEVLDFAEILDVANVDNTAQAPYATHWKTEFQGGTRYVPAMKLISGGSLTSSYHCKSKAGSYDPQTKDGVGTQYIQAIFSCMNRNKDENGDGTIDACELKWYVPAAGQYLRMILGRNNLVTPLMNYEQEILPKGCRDDFNTLYHFIASDRKIIWADEGMSSSVFDGAGTYSHAPWQVRCIRNLGTDLTSVSHSEKVTPAYTTYIDVDKDGNGTKGGFVKPTRYYGTALRNPTTEPLPPHKTSDANNRLAIYGFEIAPAGNGVVIPENGGKQTYDGEAGMKAITYNSSGVPTLSDIGANYTAVTNAIKTASPCEILNRTSGRKGWRVPNQKEVIIMMRAGRDKYAEGALNAQRYITYSVSGNDVLVGTATGSINSMMSCTQEHWPSLDGDRVRDVPKASTPLSQDNRWCTAKPGDGLASAQSSSSIHAVRCVRDLTAAEANMTYDQIKDYKPN